MKSFGKALHADTTRVFRLFAFLFLESSPQDLSEDLYSASFCSSSFPSLRTCVGDVFNFFFELSC